MRIRQWILVAGLAVCCCLANQVAAPLAAKQGDTTGNSDKNRGQENETKQQRELDVRYAKAYLRLMEATLEKYQAINRRQPKTIPSNVIRVIQEDVREARDRAKLDEKVDSKDAEVYISDAECALRDAQETLRNAEKANAVSAGSVSASEFELLKADVDLAKIRVEKARHLADESPVSDVRYELGQLREEVQQLRVFVALLREKD